MRDLSRIRVTGPLEPYVSGFVVVLVERGYKPVSIAHQLRLMAHVSRWLASERFGPDDFSSARVEQFVAARRAAGYVNYVTPRAVVALLEYLRELGVAPPAGELSLSEVEELLGRYRAWLCSERGLATGGSPSRVGGRAGDGLAGQLRSGHGGWCARPGDPDAARPARDAPRRGRGPGSR